MSDTPGDLWVIELVVAQNTKPITVRIEDRITIGRNVQGEAKRPDIDLEPYGAEGLGVSRPHVAFFVSGERLMIMDLASNNGTFLNGNRLTPNEGYRLAHGD